MMRSKLTALCLAAMMIPGAAAAAERPTGTYLGAGAGINFADDTDISGNGVNASAEHDTGYAGALSLGHAYANGIRAEVELGNRRNAIDSVDGFDTGGSANVLSAMVNTYYDFATGSAFIPYLGAGIGVGSMHLTANPVDGSAINDRGNGLALQGIAGLGYQVTENLTSTLEYRYFTVQGADLKTLGGTSIDADYQAHTVMVGLRYTFGDVKKPMPEPKPMAAAAPAPAPQPAPAPAPAPAPEITRNFIVFFDWDKADITPEAATVLRAAAENARTGGISRIQATGHADRSGTQQYNLKLSTKRAQAVQAELARQGIPLSVVAVEGKGELEPLVPTADGVREPQNRRVEIVFP